MLALAQQGSVGSFQASVLSVHSLIVFHCETFPCPF